MGTEQYPWDLHNSMKSLVTRNNTLFIQPKALNLLKHLPDILSPREVDLITVISNQKPNEDVMYELLDHLKKRPRWWERLQVALMEEGYTEEAKLLADEVARLVSQRPAHRSIAPRAEAAARDPSAWTQPNQHLTRQVTNTRNTNAGLEPLQDVQPPPYKEVESSPYHRGACAQPATSPVYQQQPTPPAVYQQQSTLQPTPPPVYQQQPTQQPTPPPVYQQQPTPPAVYQQQSTLQPTPPPVYQQQSTQQPTPPPVYQQQSTQQPTPPPVCQQQSTQQPTPPAVYQQPTPPPVYQQQSTQQPALPPLYQQPTPPPVHQQRNLQPVYRQQPIPPNVVIVEEALPPHLTPQEQLQQPRDVPEKSKRRFQPASLPQEHFPDCPRPIVADQDKMLKKYQSENINVSISSDSDVLHQNLELCQQLLCEEKENAKGTLATKTQQQCAVETHPASFGFNQKKVSQKDKYGEHLCYREQGPNADVARSSASDRPDVGMQTTSSHMSCASTAMQHNERTTGNSIHLEAAGRMSSAAAVHGGNSDVRNSSSCMNASDPPDFSKIVDSPEAGSLETDGGKKVQEYVLASKPAVPINCSGNGTNAVITEADGLSGICTSQSVCYPPSVSSSEDHKVSDTYGNDGSAANSKPLSTPKRELSKEGKTLQNDSKAFPENRESVENMDTPSTAITDESNTNNLFVPYPDVHPIEVFENKVINVSQSTSDKPTTSVDTHSENSGEKIDNRDTSDDRDDLLPPSDMANIPHLSLLESSESKTSTCLQSDHRKSNPTNNMSLEDGMSKPLFKESSNGSVEFLDISNMNEYLNESEDINNRQCILSLLQSNEHEVNDEPSFRLTTEEFHQFEMRTNEACTRNKKVCEEHIQGEHNMQPTATKVRDHFPSEMSVCEDMTLQATVGEAVDQSVQEQKPGCVESDTEHVETEKDDVPSGIPGCDKTSQMINMQAKSQQSERHETLQTSGLDEESHSEAYSFAGGDNLARTHPGRLEEDSSARYGYGTELQEAGISEIVHQPPLGVHQEVCQNRGSLEKHDSQSCCKVDEMTGEPIHEGIQQDGDIDRVPGQGREFTNSPLNESSSQDDRMSSDVTSSILSQQNDPSVLRSLLGEVTKTVLGELFTLK